MITLKKHSGIHFLPGHVDPSKTNRTFASKTMSESNLSDKLFCVDIYIVLRRIPSVSYFHLLRDICLIISQSIHVYL